eukprot:6155711-Pyramimonas_sp.AAC.1
MRSSLDPRSEPVAMMQILLLHFTGPPAPITRGDHTFQHQYNTMLYCVTDCTAFSPRHVARVRERTHGDDTFYMLPMLHCTVHTASAGESESAHLEIVKRCMELEVDAMGVVGPCFQAAVAQLLADEDGLELAKRSGTRVIVADSCE